MIQKKEPETFYPKDQREWRKWLEKNHISKQSVWLLCYKKKADKPTISWSDAVDEALCFGWIDSTRKSVDHESFIQFFCKRKSSSVWSKINKEKVQRLVEDGRMTQAGFVSIETARLNGSWEIMDDVEELVIPEDLKKQFRTYPGSRAYFMGLSKSVKKMMLQWLVLARRPETRKKRIDEIVTHAAKKMKPVQFR